MKETGIQLLVMQEIKELAQKELLDSIEKEGVCIYGNNQTIYSNKTK